MAEISPDNKQIARHAVKVLGGKPQVIAYWDDSHEYSVDRPSAAARLGR